MQHALCGRPRPDSRKRGEAPETHQQTNEISSAKSKVIANSRTKMRTNITMNGEKLEQVSSFKYLGATLTEDGTSVKEVRCRIAAAKSTMARPTPTNLEQWNQVQNQISSLSISGMFSLALWLSHTLYWLIVRRGSLPLSISVCKD